MKLLAGIVACVTLVLGGAISFAQPGPEFGPSFVPPSGVEPAAAQFPIPGDPSLQPVPQPLSAPVVPPASAPILPDQAPVTLSPAIPLFPCVKYRNLSRISPCAVPMLVAVRDPNGCRRDPCTGCVYVKVCVPQCDCPRVRIRRFGERVRYDYGKYAIDIISRRGEVVVVYHKGLF